MQAINNWRPLNSWNIKQSLTLPLKKLNFGQFKILKTKILNLALAFLPLSLMGTRDCFAFELHITEELIKGAEDRPGVIKK